MIGEIQLPEVWVTIVTIIVVPILTQLFKMIAEWKGAEIKRIWATLIAAVISLIIAGIIVAPQIPVFADWMEYLAELFTIGGILLGYATLIYNLILSKLFVVVKFAPKRTIIEYAGKGADNGNVGL